MVEPSINKDEISRILNHPEVFDWLTDDPSYKHGYTPVFHPSVIYLVNDTREGVIRIDPINSVTCSVHIATMPKMWGKGSGFCAEAIAWGFKNTAYQKVVAMIPVFNERCVGLVKKLGFEQEGILKRSFLKNWELHDQIIFGLSKGGQP